MNDPTTKNTRKRKYDSSHSSNQDELVKKHSSDKDGVDILAEAEDNQIEEESELPKIAKSFHMKKFREKLREGDFILGNILFYFESTNITYLLFCCSPSHRCSTFPSACRRKSKNCWKILVIGWENSGVSANTGPHRQNRCRTNRLRLQRNTININRSAVECHPTHTTNYTGMFVPSEQPPTMHRKTVKFIFGQPKEIRFEALDGCCGIGRPIWPRNSEYI